MTRSVDEMNHGTWTNLLNTVPVPQYEIEIEFKWTDDNGDPRSNIKTYIFPNILGSIPLGRLGRYMLEIAAKEARIRLGIDPDPDA